MQTSCVPESVARFQEQASQLVSLYAVKNSRYGDSFARSVAKYGLIAALTRISDKFNRLENLILTGDRAEETDERLYDTLVDLAAYSLMTAMELTEQ